AHYERLLSASGARPAADIRILAIPTSSTRTVLAWRDGEPDTAVFIKLSLLPSPMFGDRRIWRQKSAGCVGLTQLLESSNANSATELSYLSEPLSITP